MATKFNSQKEAKYNLNKIHLWLGQANGHFCLVHNEEGRGLSHLLGTHHRARHRAAFWHHPKLTTRSLTLAI